VRKEGGFWEGKRWARCGWRGGAGGSGPGKEGWVWKGTDGGRGSGDGGGRWVGCGVGMGRLKERWGRKEKM